MWVVVADMLRIYFEVEPGGISYGHRVWSERKNPKFEAYAMANRGVTYGLENTW